MLELSLFYLTADWGFRYLNSEIFLRGEPQFGISRYRGWEIAFGRKQSEHYLWKKDISVWNLFSSIFSAKSTTEEKMQSGYFRTWKFRVTSVPLFMEECFWKDCFPLITLSTASSGLLLGEELRDHIYLALSLLSLAYGTTAVRILFNCRTSLDSGDWKADACY